MRQLSGTDATFLAIETPTTTGHVGGLSIIDPSTATEPLTLERLTALFAERLPLIPVLHRRLHTVPLGLDQPYWVDDPDFDIEFHLRELALPAPGDDRQLGEQVARLHARPLDPRPSVVGGLPDLWPGRRSDGPLHKGPPRRGRRCRGR